ncbi:MAG: NIF family HAD-type phosphatase [Candidatus Woesearchaeota archaeon]
MSKLYIFDLEGTTGIYNQGSPIHINNALKLRPGFRETLDYLNLHQIPAAIVTRAPERYTQEIIKNLTKRGVQWSGKIYTKKDVEVEGEQLLSYKNLSQLYNEHDISEPSKETVILGDFLRFVYNDQYNIDDYLSFDFSQQPEVLTKNFALNDHPLPDGRETPTYIVLPQPWTTYDGRGAVSLDMRYIFDYLEKMFSAGGGDFSTGFEIMTGDDSVNQFIESDELSRRLLGKSSPQKYLIMKGEKKNWQPLEDLLR